MASLLNWLGGQVEGAFAQLNPFDNGADYNSVQRRRKQEEQRQVVQPPQLQRPVARQPFDSPFSVAQPKAPTVTTPQFNVADMSRSSVAKQPTPQPAPNFRIVQRTDGGFDFFNGNTKSSIDEFSRVTGADKNKLSQELANRQLDYTLAKPEQNGQALGDIKLPTLNNQSINDLRNKYKNADVYKQREILRTYQDKRNQERGFSDQNELNRNQYDLLLSGLNAEKKKGGNPLTFAEDFVRGSVDTLTNTGDRLARAADAAIGTTANTAASIQQQADSDFYSALSAYKTGKIDRPTYLRLTAQADEQARVADRMRQEQIENADPVKAAGAVANALATPLLYAVGMGTTGSAAKLGFTDTLKRAGISNALDKGIATLGVKNPVVSRAIGLAGENALSGVPSAAAQVAQDKGSAATIQDYANAQLMNAGASAAFPLVSALGGKVTKVGGKAYVNAADSYVNQARPQIPQSRLREAGILGGSNATGFSAAKKAGRVFDGVDGKPRFEIDDSGAKIKNPNGKTLGEIIDHPKLFEQYPELKNTTVKYDAGRGEYAYISGGELHIKRDTTQGTLLHEIQHLIQGKEGFAIGGSSSEFKTKSIPKQLKNVDFQRFILKNQIRQKLKEANVNIHNVKNGDLSIASMENPLVREAAKKYAPELLKKYDELHLKLMKYQTSTAQYERLAGEAEARAVQARMNLTDGERYVKPDTSYRNGHQIKDSVSVAEVKDVNALKERVKQLDGYITNEASRDFNKLVKMMKDPEADVKIYRASPKNELNGGDWVTTSKSYADYIKGQNGGKVYSYIVKAKDLHLPSDLETNPSLARFAAFQFKPKSIGVRSTFYDSLDVPKQDLIIRNNNQVRAMNIDSSRSNEAGFVEIPSGKPKSQPKKTPVVKADTPTSSVSSLDDKNQRISNPQSVPPSANPQRAAQPVESSSLVKVEPSSNRIVSQSGKTQLKGRQTDTKTLTTVNRSYIDNTTTEVKKRGFTQSVKVSAEVSPTVRKQVSGEYNIRSTDKMALEANKFAQGNLKKVTVDVNDRLAKKLGTITDQDIADSIAVAKRLDSRGSFDASQQIYDRLAEHGTKGGQTIQAFSLLQNRTPEGIKFQMLRNLKKAGVSLTNDQQKEVGKLIDKIRKTKPNTEARNRALFDTLDYVSKKIPNNNGDKIINFWRAGLLTAPKTTGGNIIGNTSELAARELWANPIAVATDKFFSIFTGKRTKTLSGGQLKGMKEGVVKGMEYMRTGYDPRNISSKWDAPRRVNYKNKAIDTYVNGVYRWMGTQDQPFYYGAKAAAAHDLAKADAINLGYKGKKLADYVEQAVSDSNWKPQTFKTQKSVENYARYAVYQNDTLLGQMAKGVKEAADRKGLRWMTDFVLPFTQVPSSIAMRVVDRTPIGTARELIKQIRRGSFDQRAMAEAIGNGSFGIPVVAAGYALSKAGEITGDYPTDSKERKLWDEEGKQPYSVRIGNKWYSLNYLQPFGTILNIGKNLDDQKKAGKSDSEAWMTAAGSAGQSVTDQSFLKGLNGVLSALNDPDRSLEQFTKSTASSTVPNFIRSFATATDDKQRDTRGTNIVDSSAKAVQGSIPGLRQGLPEKKGMFGNTLERRDDAINSYLNPLRPSKVNNQNDPLINELRRLQDAGSGIVTTDFNKNAIKDVELTDTQIRELNQQVNSRVKPEWDKAIADPRYQSLSDEDKNTILKRIKDNIAKEVKGEFVKANNLQTTGKYSASNSDSFGTKVAKKPKTKVASTRRKSSGGRSSGGITQGRELVNLTAQLNKIQAPRVGLPRVTGIRTPQLAKTPVRKYQVRTAKAQIKSKSSQKPKTA